MIRKGHCLKCGACCNSSHLWNRMTKEFKNHLRKEDIRFYIVLKAMADLDLDCPYLFRNADGTTYCTIYKVRPTICRLYPPDKDSLIEGCGYYFED